VTEGMAGLVRHATKEKYLQGGEDRKHDIEVNVL